jgi:glycerate dehydrogenase
MPLPAEPTVVFLDRETLAPSVRLRPPAFPHRWVEHQRTAPDEVLPRLRGASVAVLNKVPLREDVLAQLPDLRLVAVAATGTDCVDTAWCDRNGIAVANIRGYAVHTVPEHVFTLILALRRSLLPYRRSVEAGRWQEARQFCFFDHPILDLHGARLGLVGGGSLGNAVATIAGAFGMEVVFAGRKGDAAPAEGRMPFDEVIATSDVISLHCPLRPETRGLIGAAEFARMKPEAILINTARGGLVDEAALTEALRSGRIGGAGFDVAMPEPPPADAPLMRLLDLPNFILTPHVAWAGRGAMQALADQLIDLVDGFQQGKPFNLVAGGRQAGLRCEAGRTIGRSPS